MKTPSSTENRKKITSYKMVHVIIIIYRRGVEQRPKQSFLRLQMILDGGTQQTFNFSYISFHYTSPVHLNFPHKKMVRDTF